jgi:stage V sporulation protein B
LTGMAAPLINLPTIITISLSASLVPAISEAMALRDIKLAASRAETGVRISFIFGLPAALGMFVLATPITTLLYGNSEAGACLAVLSWGIIFLLLNQTTTGILQGLGKAFIPVRNLLLGAVLKIILNYTLTSIPYINVKGAALGSVVAYLFSAVLNFVSVIKWTGLKIDVNKMIIKPVIASAGMGAAVYFAYENMVVQGLSQNKSTFVAIVIGAFIYALLLFIIGGVQRQDLEVLPGGQRIVGLLDKFAIFRR